jgi:hypothetical protein
MRFLVLEVLSLEVGKLLDAKASASGQSFRQRRAGRRRHDGTIRRWQYFFPLAVGRIIRRAADPPPCLHEIEARRPVLREPRDVRPLEHGSLEPERRLRPAVPGEMCRKGVVPQVVSGGEPENDDRGADLLHVRRQCEELLILSPASAGDGHHADGTVRLLREPALQMDFGHLVERRSRGFDLGIPEEDDANGGVHVETMPSKAEVVLLRPLAPRPTDDARPRPATDA